MTRWRALGRACWASLLLLVNACGGGSGSAPTSGGPPPPAPLYTVPAAEALSTTDVEQVIAQIVAEAQARATAGGDRRHRPCGQCFWPSTIWSGRQRP